MTAGSSCGTSETNNACAARPPSRAVSRPPLMREIAVRRGVELADGDARRERRRGQPPEIGERCARLQHLHQSRGAAGDQEQGMDVRRQLLHPREQALSGGERALIGHRMRAHPHLRTHGRRQRVAAVRVAGDDERALERRAERLVGTERHGDGGLADGRDPHRRVGGAAARAPRARSAVRRRAAARSAAAPAAARGGGRWRSLVSSRARLSACRGAHGAQAWRHPSARAAAARDTRGSHRR